MKRNLCKECNKQMVRREIFAAFTALGNRSISVPTISPDSGDRIFCELCGCELQDEEITIK